MVKLVHQRHQYPRPFFAALDEYFSTRFGYYQFWCSPIGFIRVFFDPPPVFEGFYQAAHCGSADAFMACK